MPSGSNRLEYRRGWHDLFLGINTGTEQLRLQFRLSNGTDFFAQKNNAATLIPPDTWTHVAAVRDGGSIRLFVNGSEIAPDFTAGTSTLAPADTNQTLFLGSHNTWGGNYWRGAIDEVRIYQGALDPAEITALAAYDPFDTGDLMLDWKNEVFAGLPQGANDPQAADLVDIESDGWVNLLEYAFGFDPFTADAANPITVEPSPAGVIHFTFRRLRGTGSGATESGYTIGGITYTPAVSNTLAADSWNSSGVWLEQVGVPEDNGDGTETVTLRALTPNTTPTGPADPQKHFFRLEVVR